MPEEKLTVIFFDLLISKYSYGFMCKSFQNYPINKTKWTSNHTFISINCKFQAVVISHFHSPKHKICSGT